MRLKSYGIKLIGICLLLGLWMGLKSTLVNAQTTTPNPNQIGLMLDSARIYNSPAVIEQYIDLLSANHGTFLQLHLTDNENFGVENDLIQQTPTKNSYKMGDTYYNTFTRKPYLTKAQLKTIIDYGQQRGIQVIPEIDVPGHSKALIDQLKHLHQTKLVKSIVNPYSKTDELNYHKTKVIKYVQKLIGEYTPLLPTQSYLATGGDEDTVTDNADVKAITKFENSLNQMLNQKQLQMQLWNDNVHKKNLKTLQKNIRILYWSQSGETSNKSTNAFNIKTRATLPQINQAGFKSINANAYYLYVLAEPNKLDNISDASVRSSVTQYSTDLWNGTSADQSNVNINNVGSMLSIWGDKKAIDSNQLYQQVSPVFQSFSQHLFLLDD